MKYTLDDLSEENISKRLRNAWLDSPKIPGSEFPIDSIKSSELLQSAAVLIPFLKWGNEWHVLFTRRTNTLPEHSGQVAFPGGRCDPDDGDPVSTALRETQEEIGIDPEKVNILGRLRDFITVTNYIVSPFVGLIPWPYPLTYPR